MLLPESSTNVTAYRLTLFGDCQLRSADRDELIHVGRKARAIIAYLVLGRDQARRDDLAALLWSDRGLEQSRASLRQACFELRHAMPKPRALLKFTRYDVVLDRSLLMSNIDLAAGSDKGANALASSFTPGRRVLLRDLNGLSPAFDEWLRVERVWRADQRRNAALEAVRRACAEGRLIDAQCVARAFLTMEPVDEEIAYLAVSASIQLGELGEAQRLYRIHADAMRKELDSPPNPAIAALVRGQVNADTPGAILDACPQPEAPDLKESRAQGAKLPAYNLQSGNAPARSKPIRRLVAAMAAILLGVALVATARNTWLIERPPAPLVAIEPFSTAANDTVARSIGAELPAMVAKDLVGTQTPVEIADGTVREPGGASLIVRGNIANAAGLLRAEVQLIASPSARVVWASTFNRPEAESVQFGEQLALRIGRELNCAYSNQRARYSDADPEFARISLAHCDAIDGDMDEALSLSRQITERAPRFAHGWAEHAYDLAEKSFWLPPKLADDAVAQAQREADRARTMNPHDGLAYTARLITMTGLSLFDAREALIRQGLEQAPKDATLYMAKANGRWGLGRLQEALEAARRSSQYNRFLPGMVVEQAGLEGDLGDVQDARRLIRKARALWPQQQFVDRLGYRLALYWGNPDEAVALLDADRITGYSKGHLDADRAFAAWRKSPSPQSTNYAGRVIEKAAATTVEPEYVQLLAAMGMIDRAYRLAERLPPSDHGDPGWYRDYTSRFRADRRFMPLAARLGLAQVWLRTGLWPDFCYDEQLSYDCRKAALAAVRPSIG